MRLGCVIVSLLLVSFASSAIGQESEVSILRSESKPSADQRQMAVVKLAEAGEASLIPILNGMKDANPINANWLRGAFEATAGKLMKSGKPLPGSLIDFISETTNDGRARRLAYDWMLQQDASLSKKMIPDMLFDPVPEFRRDAIRLLITEGTKQLEGDNKDAAKATFEKALSAAIHDDQVKQIIEPLKELGREVNLQKHFGFLPEWSIIGPFNNKEGVGFAAVYPPEKELNLKAELDGEFGKVAWKKFSTEDKYGAVNIAKLIKNYKGSCMYATTEFNSDREQTLELRMSTPNAWKLWINGKFVFGREEYHRTPSNMVMDTYQIPVKLKAGANRILLKVCQNEQEDTWAQRYQFNARVCDETGTAVKQTTARKSASTN
jgi:hypothetical protein